MCTIVHKKCTFLHAFAMYGRNKVHNIEYCDRVCNMYIDNFVGILVHVLQLVPKNFKFVVIAAHLSQGEN